MARAASGGVRRSRRLPDNRLTQRLQRLPPIASARGRKSDDAAKSHPHGTRSTAVARISYHQNCDNRKARWGSQPFIVSLGNDIIDFGGTGKAVPRTVRRIAARDPRSPATGTASGRAHCRDDRTLTIQHLKSLAVPQRLRTRIGRTAWALHTLQLERSSHRRITAASGRAPRRDRATGLRVHELFRCAQAQVRL